jgi:hypothetical protein
MQTIAALYRTFADADRAARALELAGVDPTNVSMMAREGVVIDRPALAAAVDPDGGAAATGAAVGAAAGGLGGLLVGLGLLTVPGLGPIFAAGTLAAAVGSSLAGAGIGAATGTVVGALVDLGIPPSQAGAYAEGVKRGGVLMTVVVPDYQVEPLEQLLLAQGALDIHEAATHWRNAGWQGFDEQPPTGEYPTL